MKIFNNKILNYLFISVFFVLLLLIQECRHNKDVSELVSDINTYKTEAKSYKNKFGKEVSYNKSLVFENEKLLKKYLKSNDTILESLKGFKTVNNYIKVKEYITITDSIPFIKRIPYDFKPFRITRDSVYYNFVGTIAPTYFRIDTLFIPNEQSIVVGEKKIGVFKKEFRVEITNSNPLIKTTNIGSYTFKEKKKWYERPLVHLGAGIIIGLGLNKIDLNMSNQSNE